MVDRISIDEFEPKTGKVNEVMVVGFQVIEQSMGEDLYNFINSSAMESRDVEVSPNPNPDDYYMVFVEIDRNDKSLSKIREMVQDIENVTGPLPWTASTHLTDEFFPLNETELEQYVLLDPDNYMSREEWMKQQDAAADQEPLEEDTHDADAVMEFLQSSDLSEARLENDVLHLAGRGDSVQLEFVSYGEASDVMRDLGINESALKPLDSVYRKFNSMLGEMRAVPIGEYVVIYHPNSTNVIVGRNSL
jgi:hypothetical protein